MLKGLNDEVVCLDSNIVGKKNSLSQKVSVLYEMSHTWRCPIRDKNFQDFCNTLSWPWRSTQISHTMSNWSKQKVTKLFFPKKMKI